MRAALRSTTTRVPRRELGVPTNLAGMGLLEELVVVLAGSYERVVWNFWHPADRRAGLDTRPVLAYGVNDPRRAWVVGGRYTVRGNELVTRSARGVLTSELAHDLGEHRRHSDPLKTAVNSYIRTHWGLRPGVFVSGLLGLPQFAVTIGRAASVAYFTEKRGDGLSTYEHPFRYPPRIFMSPSGDQLFWERRGYIIERDGITDEAPR